MSHNLRIITVAQPIPGVIKVVPVDGTKSRPKTLRGKRSCFFSHMDTVRECTRIWRPFGTRWSNALKLNVKISTVPTDQHITTQAPQSLGETLRAWIKEFIQFGLVGATAFVIDMGLFNLFQHGPLGFLSGHVNTANALAASIATIYSWIMNRVELLSSACCSRTTSSVWIRLWPTIFPPMSSASRWERLSASFSITTSYSR